MFRGGAGLPAANTGRTTPRPTRASAGPAPSTSTGRSTGSTRSRTATTAPPCTSSRRTAARPGSPSPRCPSAPTGPRTGCARGACGAGDRILVMLGNQAELWETALAAMKLRAVVIPATPLLGPADLRDRVEPRPGPACDRTRRGHRQVRRGARRLHPHRGRRGVPQGWLPYEEAYGAPAELRARRRPTRADDPLMLYFTSGTTAQPKLVEHTHVVVPDRASGDHVLDRPEARRRAPEHLLPGLGQARLVQPLRPLERRGDRLHPQLHALRRRPG